MKRTKWSAAALVAALLLLTVLLTAQSSGRAVFGWVVANTLTVRNEAIVQAGGLTVGDGDTTLADDLNVSPQPILTLTMNGWLTPTGSFQPVRSAGTVSVSGARIAAGTQGQMLYLYNMGAQTITISETTGLVSAGNIALGTLDAATLVYSGTTWIQLSGSNN